MDPVGGPIQRTNNLHLLALIFPGSVLVVQLIGLLVCGLENKLVSQLDDRTVKCLGRRPLLFLRRRLRILRRLLLRRVLCRTLLLVGIGIGNRNRLGPLWDGLRLLHL